MTFASAEKFYIGGSIMDEHNFVKGFSGCIHQVKINGVEVRLKDDPTRIINAIPCSNIDR